MSTLKKQKQRSTPLSTSKKGSVKGLKNVLVQPEDISWPTVTDETERNSLCSMLINTLPTKKNPVNTMSWAKRCRLSKEERLTLKKNLQAESSEAKDDTMAFIVLGINSVTRSLERGDLCSVLIDTNIDPLFLIKHIVVMCKKNIVPVLQVPFLKTVTLNNMGFASAALGIKKSVLKVETTDFYKLHEEIGRLYFPQKNKAPIQLFNADNKNKSYTSSSLLQDYLLLEPYMEKSSDSNQETYVSPDIYKYRNSCKERVFIPPNSQPPAPGEKVELWNDFIALGSSDEVQPILNRNKRYVDIHQTEEESSSVKKLKVDSSNSTGYIPLRVRKIQGNPMRLKETKTPKRSQKIIIKK